MELKPIFVLFSFIGLTLAGPLSWSGASRCSRQCTKSSKFDYKEGTTYAYDYESTNTVYDADEFRSSPFRTRAKLQITVLGPCDMVLEVKQAELVGSDGKDTVISEFSDYPLPFSFQDGRIEEICPSPSDDEKIVNVKRAMLSALQNSMGDLEKNDYVKESDIVGTCQTNYEVKTASRRQFTIKKSKEFGSCEDRFSGNTAILFPLAPVPNANPIVKDEKYECEQIIESGIITSVRCKESSRFAFFSSRDHDYKSDALVTLRLEKTSPSRNSPTYEISKRQPLLYSHVPEKFTDRASEEALQILVDMCSRVSRRSMVDEEMPRLFAHLVQTLRKVHPHKIENIYRRVEDGLVCQSPWLKSLINDALPYIGHEGSVKIIAKKIESGSVSKFQRAYWVTSLAFIKYPTEAAIAAVVPLLDYDKAGKQALLGITAMCNNYCKRNTDCESSNAIQRVIESLNRYLSYKCKVSGNREINQVITALKGFGNLGRVGIASKQILECAAEESNAITVRLAAIEAFRRTPCNNEIKQRLLSIFSRRGKSVEVRIAAYLGVMKCVDTDVMRKIKQVYDSESLNQIKAFVYSHITNLQESSSPEKGDIRRILQEFNFESHHLDIRKYSQNIEWSAYYQHLKLGGEFESNVIYSHNSFLPRSFMTNITAFLRDKMYNVMEIGGRLEGLDQVLERLFSPTGEYGQMSFTEFTSYMMGVTDKKTQPQWTSKMPSYKFQSKMDSFTKTMKTDVPSSLGASFYFKHQGNELLWVTVDGKTDFNFGKIVDFMDILSELARNQRIDTAHSIYLDTCIDYPSISGGAISLDFNGTVIVGVKGEGKIDVRKALISQPNVDIDGSFHVSFAGEVNAAMSYKSFSESSRVKYVARAHGGGIVKGQLVIKDGHVLNMRLDLPEDKLDLLSINVDIVRIDKYGREVSDRPKSSHSGCVKLFRKVIGYDICAELALPKSGMSSHYPHFPATAPFSTKITLLKHDRSMRGLVFNVELPNHNVYSTKKFKIEFDTPGSSYDRKHALEVVFVEPSNEVRSFDIQLQTPYKVAEVKVGLTNSPEKKSVKFDLIVDRNRHWALLADLGKSYSGDTLKYNTKIELQSPNEKPIQLIGSINCKTGRKTLISINLHANSPTYEIIGHLMKEGEMKTISEGDLKLSTDMKIKLPFIETHILGSAEQTGKLIVTTAKIEYQRQGEERNTLTTHFKVQNLSSQYFTKFVTSGQLHSTEDPHSNLVLSWDLQYKPEEIIHNDIKIKGGSDMKILLHFFQSSKIKKDDYKKFYTDNRVILIIPKWDIDYGVKFFVDHDGHIPKGLVKAELKLNEGVNVKSSLKYHLMSTSPSKLGFDFNLEYREAGINILSTNQFDEVSPNEYKGSSKLQWKHGQEAKFDYTYKIKSESENVHHEIDASFDAPWLKAPIEHKGLFKTSENALDLKSSTNYKGKLPYKINIKIAPKGPNKVNIDLPQYAKSDVQFDVSSTNTLIKFDISRPQSGRRILGYVKAATKPNLSAQIALSWDADRNPSAKLVIETEAQTVSSWSDKSYVVSSKLRYKSNFEAHARGKINRKILQGPHDLQIDVKERQKPLSMKMHHEVKDGVMNCKFSCDYDSQQIGIVTTGKYIRRGSRLEISCDSSISSSNREWDGKAVHFTHAHDLSDSMSIRSELQISQTTDKQYGIKTEFTRTNSWSSKVFKVSLSMQTPIRGWKTREINFSGEKSKNQITFNSDFNTDEGRKFTVSCDTEKTNYGNKLQCEIQLPTSRKMKTAKVLAAYNWQPSNYKVQCQILANGQTKLDFNGNLVGHSMKNFASNVEFKSSATPSFGGHIISKMDSASKEFDLSFTKNSVEKLSGKFSTQRSRSEFTGSAELDANGKRIVDVNIICENKGTSKSCSINLSGAIKPTTIKVNYRKEDTVIKPNVRICWESKYKNTECVEIDGYFRNDNNRYYGDGNRELKLNVKRPRGGDVSVEFLEHVSKKNYKNKLVITYPNKKIGYDGNLDLQSARKMGQLQLYLPSRVMKIEGTLQTERNSPIILTSEWQLDVERAPRKKMSLELFHKNNLVRGNREVISKIEVKHPELRKPISAKFEMHSRLTEIAHPLDAKLELDYSENPKDNIICSVQLQTARRGEGNNTILFNIHKHERQYLDFTVESHLGRTRELMSCGLRWELVSQRTRRKSGFSLIQILPLEKSFGIWHQCDVTKFEGRGNWRTSNDVFNTEVDVRINDREPKKIDAVIDYRQPCLDVAYYSRTGDVPKTKYHFCVNSASRNILSVSANTFFDSSKVTDFSLVFDKNSARVFTLDLKWVPNILGKILSYFSEISIRIDAIKRYLIPDEMIQTIRDAFSTVKRDIYQPLYKIISKEISQLSYEVKNEMKVIIRSLQELYDKIQSKVEIKKVLQRLKKSVNDMRYELKRTFAQIFPDSIAQYVRNMKRFVTKKIDSVCTYGTYCYELKSYFKRHGIKGVIREILNCFSDLLSEKLKINLRIGNISKVLYKSWATFRKSLRDRLYRVLEKFHKFRYSLNNFIDNHGKSVRKVWYSLKEEISDKIKDVLVFWDDIKDMLTKNDDVKAIITTLKEMRDEVIMELSKVKIDKLTRDIQKSFVNAFTSLSLKDTTTVLVFDPDRGKLRVELHSPVDPRRLKHTLKSVWKPKHSSSWKMKSFGMYSAIGDAIEKTWIPPYDAYAVLIDGEHFKTFDDSTFSIAGDCSFLLMNDFVDGNITIFSKHIGSDNYGKSQKSLVITNPDGTIEVNPHSSSVLLNDVPVELPFYNSFVTILRDGNLIDVQDKRGIGIKCHLVYNFCTASLSGWYYGKTAGMFGTLDYEPSTDFIDPSGKHLDSVDQFAEGWKVTHQCKHTVLPKKWSDQTEEGYRMCQRYFADPESNLQPCFHKVPPEHYFQLCLSSSVQSGFAETRPSQSMCNIAASYASVCKTNGYHVTLPDECLGCTMDDGSNMEYDDTRRISSSHNSWNSEKTVDVVFIIEESECNNELIQNIGQLADNLDNEFRSGGFENNLFSVIAYGGRNEELIAHSHTARGKVFFPARDMDIAVRNMKLSYEPQHNLDVFGVIWHAAEHPLFRESSTKAFVLMPCGKCQSSAMSVGYKKLVSRLNSYGIYLHILSNSPLFSTQSSKSFQTSNQMQFDWGSNYGSQTPQSDVCVSLIKDVHGIFFNIRTGTELTFNDATKNWSMMFSRRVSKINPLHCRVCQCVQDEYHVAKVKCFPCSENNVRDM